MTSKTETSKPETSVHQQSGSDSHSQSSSYHIQRWGGETDREQPFSWSGGESKEARTDRAKTRIHNFDKRWDQSRWRWVCCSCHSANLSYTYDLACPMCHQQRCVHCSIFETS